MKNICHYLCRVKQNYFSPSFREVIIEPPHHANVYNARPFEIKNMLFNCIFFFRKNELDCWVTHHVKKKTRVPA